MSANTPNNNIQRISKLAKQVQEVCINPVSDGASFAPDSMMMESVGGTASKSELFGQFNEHAGAIAGVWSRSISQYQREKGRMPRPEQLASAANAINNLMVENTTSKDIIIPARSAALALPVLLRSTLGDASGYLATDYNSSSICYMERKAGTNFGSKKAGDVIKTAEDSQYSHMAQTYPFTTQPDGTKKKFTFNTKTSIPDTTAPHGVAYPSVGGTTTVLLDGHVAATDFFTPDKLIGSCEIKGKTYSFTGKVDSVKGITEVTCTSIIPTGMVLEIIFEIDLEAAPNLIPTIDIYMHDGMLKPHRSYLKYSSTIQAGFAMSREYGVDIDMLHSDYARNHMANQNDAAGVRKMLKQCIYKATLPYPQKAQLVAKLLDLSDQMLLRTDSSGIVGVFCGLEMARIIKSLDNTIFTPAPAYNQQATIHYVGRLAGIIDIYQAADVVPDLKAMCFGRGPEYGQCPFYSGTVLPFQPIKDATNPTLRNDSVIYDVSYNDVNPIRQGVDYLVELEITGK